MKIRIGIGLGPAAGPAGFGAAVQSPRRTRHRLAVAVGDGVRAAGGAVHRDGLCPGRDGQAEGGHRSVRAARPASCPGRQAAGHAGGRWRLAGSCRSSACSRPAGRASALPGAAWAARRGVRRGRFSSSGCCWSRQRCPSGQVLRRAPGPASDRCLPSRSTSGWAAAPRPGCGGPAGSETAGWAASCPGEAGAGRRAIQQAASAAGREIDPSTSASACRWRPTASRTRLPARSGSVGQDTDPASLVASGWPGARRMIEQYVAAGISKFVVRPAARPRTPAAARPQASAAAGAAGGQVRRRTRQRADAAANLKRPDRVAAPHGLAGPAPQPAMSTYSRLLSMPTRKAAAFATMTTMQRAPSKSPATAYPRSTGKSTASEAGEIVLAPDCRCPWAGCSVISR